ncbi:hypothetical protein [Bacillus sp. JCM 19034]|uniref:hypothetical protein n=1 Tax=Bacillus sp. JCM 19034 TaxID=1481928 RepID=UPI000AB23E51|nr:hypothetical protein [Bacillus sp. JCM 19034]
MIIRLIGMYLLSLVFIHTGYINAKTGAYIFLFGMMIESAVSFIEGRVLVKKMIKKDPTHHVERKSQVFRFYYPLIISSLIIVMVGPLINIFLGRTAEIELAIAAYALALSVTQLFLSFFSYVHQIVLTFYKDHPKKVRQFTLLVGFIPTLLLALFCFTPIGSFVVEHLLGANERLMLATLDTLKVFLIMALVFPFIDFCNGILMIRNQTNSMVISQSMNLVITFIVVAGMTAFAPTWNGMIGAMAQSLGMVAELAVLMVIVLKAKRAIVVKRKVEDTGV